MNKIASIYFLQELGLPTISPNIINFRDEKLIRKKVDSFYFDYNPGWVLRCGEPPDKTRRVERGLPWDTAKGKEDLVEKIIFMQRKISSNYAVFCHPVMEMVRGGIMLIDGDRVVVESATGGPRELSSFYRGYRSPEQQIIFNPGMLSHKRYGKDVLLNKDLLDLRNIERTLNWVELNAVSNPVSIEFSWLKNGNLYVHDLSVIN